jgi:hypothetical protein
MTRRPDGWRGPILQHFSEASAKVCRLTVVSDPDELLTESGAVERLAARGFELITFEDPVAFRYAYESRFRQHWDRGETSHLVVVIRTGHGELQHIPYDLLEEARESGRVLSFGLSHLFPTLAPNVLAELDRQYFDAVAYAVEKASPGHLGTNATRDFVLRHVFEIAPEVIKQPADLLRVLLRRHYRSQILPESLDARFIELLMQGPTWRVWPLERIVRNRQAFLTFLAERWPLFLVGKGFDVVPGTEPPSPTIPGPLDLPFDHDDVRVYMDNLFVEGVLQPTAVVEPTGDDRWYSVGIVGAPASSVTRRFAALTAELVAAVPSADRAPVGEWQTFAQRWGTWIRLRHATSTDRDAPSVASAGALVQRVQTAFSAWLLRWFGPMATLPYLPQPVLGHQVPHYLAHRAAADGRRVALLVIDGMAFDQWRILEPTFDGFNLEEHAIFSWIPTLTQVARQAMFSGRLPMEFATTIEGTYREPRHWATFWDDHGYRTSAVRYVAPQGRKASFEPLADEIRHAARDPSTRVIGAVVGVIDQNMHQIALGTPGLHALVDVWAKKGELPQLVGDLIALDYDVFVTADHGNVFGRGIGKPDVGEAAEQRGERAHVFRHKALRDGTAQLYPDAIAWPSIGLPDDYFPLIAPPGGCFLPLGKEAVSHGGISVEEVIVPFVRVTGHT